MGDHDKDEGETAIKKFRANLVLEDGHLIAIQLKKPKADDSAKTVLAFEYDTERLERLFGVLSKLQRKDRPVALGLSFVEQLELPKSDAKAEQNGHAPAADGLAPITPIHGERASERAMRETDGGKKKREKART